MSGGRELLRISDLSIALPAGGDRAFAVDDVSLTVSRGEIVCLVGESGSGKSMLAGAVIGLLPGAGVRIAKGRIDFDGCDLTRLSERAYRRLRGRRIGMIFQEPMVSLNPVLTIGDQSEEALAAHGVTDRAERRARLLHWLDAVELPDPERVRHAYPFRLSGGQRQRAMIGGALSLDPDLLIADEPTTALDATTQKQILTLLRRLQRERDLGIVLVTHDFGVVADVADRVAVMREGRIVEQGQAAEVLNHPRHPYTQALIAAVPRRGPGVPQIGEPAPPLVEIAGLRKVYGRGPGVVRRGRRVAALDGVDLTVRQGEILGVVGESGSGKTTLGHCVTRLVAPDAGTIRWRGHDFLALKGRELRAARRHVQMVFQDPGGSLNPRHRVGPIIAEAPQRYGLSRAEAEARARSMLDQVGLGAAAFHRFPHEFSGGQRQRIGIARALALEPELIVADEPVSALDVSIQAEILALLAELRRRFGLTMLFITHDLRVARQVCDRIAVMRAGAIVELGEAQAIFSQPRHPYTRALLDAAPGASWAPLRRASNVNAEEEGAVSTS